MAVRGESNNLEKEKKEENLNEKSGGRKEQLLIRWKRKKVSENHVGKIIKGEETLRTIE